MGQAFPAKYSGRCPGCSLSISPGDMIRLDEDRVALHADCSPAPATRAPVICPRCYLSRPCGCDDDD